MSETPITDAHEIEVYPVGGGKVTGTGKVYSSVARKLERDNTRLRALLAYIDQNKSDPLKVGRAVEEALKITT